MELAATFDLRRVVRQLVERAADGGDFPKVSAGLSLFVFWRGVGFSARGFGALRFRAAGISDRTMKTMTVADAARNFSEFVNRVHSGGESALLVKGGKPMVKVIPVRHANLGRELAVDWRKLPHLSVAEAEALGNDIAESRRRLAPVRSKWD